MPKISLIVPVYNAGKHLSRCIDSILAQKFTDFELILVNDGSKDNSLEICNQYSGLDARVVVVSRDNGGVSSARNHGIEVSTGDYICFIDADDYVKPDYLEQLFAEVQLDTRIDLVLQGRIKKGGSVQATISPGMDKTFFLNEDSAFIQKNGIHFLKELNHGEDFDFLAKYLCYCNGVHVSSSANYYYMINDGSLSSRFSSFNDEYVCLTHLNTSLLKLCQHFQDQALVTQVKEFLAYYTARVLTAVYEPPRAKRSVRISRLKNIDNAFVQTYRDYFIPPTRSNKVFKFLYLNKYYRLFDWASMMWRIKMERGSC